MKPLPAPTGTSLVPPPHVCCVSVVEMKATDGETLSKTPTRSDSLLGRLALCSMSMSSARSADSSRSDRMPLISADDSPSRAPSSKASGGAETRGERATAA